MPPASRIWQVDKSEISALELASRKGSLPAVEALLLAGAPPPMQVTAEITRFPSLA